MKTKTNRKLTLCRETLRNLDPRELAAVAGGITIITGSRCCPTASDPSDCGCTESCDCTASSLCTESAICTA